MSELNQAKERESFDIDKLIKALKDDDKETIAKQRQLMPQVRFKSHIQVDDAIGTAILKSDLKLAEQLGTMVIERSGGPASENLPFWANFIHVGMTDRYFNHWETQPLFLGLCKIVKERMFDPWPCITHAHLFIKLIRLGLGSDPVQFTEKGESLTYYVVTTNRTSIQNKVNILRFLQYRKILDLAPCNGFPSPLIAAITKRYSRLWNVFFSGLESINTVHDEHGNNILYYVLKKKMKINVRTLWHQLITMHADMFCEKSHEGKAMIEYLIQDGQYPYWWLSESSFRLSYRVFQKLAKDKELEVLQRLSPISQKLPERFSFLFAQHEVPNYNVLDRVMQYYTQKKIQKVNYFVGGYESTFNFELLPIEIFSLIAMELSPGDIFCLKLSSKLIEMAVDRTGICQRLLSTHFSIRLGTRYNSPKEFEQQVRIDANWKKYKYRVREQANDPLQVMDEHWIFTSGYNRHLHNIRSGQSIKISADARYERSACYTLLDSNPTDTPLVARLDMSRIRLYYFSDPAQPQFYDSKNLRATFRYPEHSSVSRYMRQLEGKQMILGREGAVWNYEVDATTGHLLGNAEPNTAILGADARDSVIATATTSVVSLWDHRTLKHIIDFSEGINPNSDWSAFYYRPLTQPVYLHENEVVFANSTGLCYYERRMNKLLQSIPFLLIEQRRDHPTHIFDVTGSRCAVSSGSLLMICNIKERGWETVTMVEPESCIALNSYAMYTRDRQLFLFD
jgi:hypothetical protein